MTLWSYVRLAVVIFAAVGACFVHLGPRAAPPLGWEALAVIFGACFLGLPVVLAIQVVNPWSAQTWRRPSWSVNPFNFRDPLQFFHLGAYGCLAQGLVIFVRVQLSSTAFYVESLVPLAMGVGILLGIRMVEIVFSSKVANGT